MSGRLKIKLSPSMMCSDIGKLAETLEIFDSSGVDYLHIDVMDGCFVPNFALGTDYVRALRKMSKIPIDAHLMIERPEDKISWFAPEPGDYFSVHYESTPHIARALMKIKEYGAKPMVALNPGTHYGAIEYLLDDIDAVLIMTVNPGYAGQKFLESSLEKIRSLRNWLDETGRGRIEIEADGNASLYNAKRMKEAGANIFVSGSSGIFAPGPALPEAIGMFKREMVLP